MTPDYEQPFGRDPQDAGVDCGLCECGAPANPSGRCDDCGERMSKTLVEVAREMRLGPVADDLGFVRGRLVLGSRARLYVVERAIDALKEARRLLGAAGCPKTEARVKAAISSAYGARRHARLGPYRAARRMKAKGA